MRYSIQCVLIDSAREAEAESAVARAWDLAAYGEIPPPLEDSPKCPGCSLVGICLPDETNLLRLSPESESRAAVQLKLFPGRNGQGDEQTVEPELRRLITPRDDPCVDLFDALASR